MKATKNKYLILFADGSYLIVTDFVYFASSFRIEKITALWGIVKEKTLHPTRMEALNELLQAFM